MNRIFSIIVFLLLSSVCFAQEGRPGEPVFSTKLVSTERIHDFGKILEKDGKVKHTFTLRNESQRTLEIITVNAWCGCTTATFSKEPIRPGKTTQVTVTYDPYSRPGHFSKEVMVFFDGADGPVKEFTRMWVKGDVIPFKHPIEEDHPYELGEGLRVSQKILPFPPRKVGEEYVFKLHIGNASKEVMHIQLDKRPNNQVLKVPAELTLQPDERTIVEVRYRMPRIHKYNCHILLQPIVNGKETQPIRVTWLGQRQ